MDLQQFVNHFDTMTCILSVEKKEDGSCGEIRIVTGNREYIESIENPPENIPRMMSTRFEPNSLYEHYFPRDLNFDLYCYACAVERKPMHAYINPGRFDYWFDIYMLPLGHEGNLYYCTYTQEVSKRADPKKLAGISQETARSVLNTCIKLRGVKDEAEFETTMRSVIVDIRDLCKARNCAVLLLDEERKECRVLSEAIQTTQGLTEKRQSMMPDFYEVALSWMDTIGGSNCLIVKDEFDMEYIRKRNPVWHKSLMEAHVQSIVIFPLKGGDEQLIGYIWATNFDTVDTLHIKETLELSTYFIASEIANHLLLIRLRELSSMDMLTGIMNRNEMNNRIDELREGKATVERLGIVFADLNGLKRVNDQYGHVEGDTMLKESAAVLRQVFPGDEIYRAGGDEFMIITRGAEEEELRERCEEIKRQAARHKHVAFAVGYCVISDSRGIRAALKTADERMYRDKETYYQDHPEIKR